MGIDRCHQIWLHPISMKNLISPKSIHKLEMFFVSFICVCVFVGGGGGYICHFVILNFSTLKFKSRQTQQFYRIYDNKRSSLKYPSSLLKLFCIINYLFTTKAYYHLSLSSTYFIINLKIIGFQV